MPRREPDVVGRGTSSVKQPGRPKRCCPSCRQSCSTERWAPCSTRRGVFINRCYDELNLTGAGDGSLRSPTEYLQAGAEVIETNTFGANAPTPGALRVCEERLAEINQRRRPAGPRIRRADPGKAGDSDAFVAGALGPLGVRLGTGPRQAPSRSPPRAKPLPSRCGRSHRRADPVVGPDLLIA